MSARHSTNTNRLSAADGPQPMHWGPARDSQTFRPSRVRGELPIKCFHVFLNRPYTPDEYYRCYRFCYDCVAASHNNQKPPYNPRDPENFRQIITLITPLLVLNHLRIPVSKCTDSNDTVNKNYVIEVKDDGAAEDPEGKKVHEAIGYHSLYEGSLSSTITATGSKERVIHVGIGTKQVQLLPEKRTVSSYIKSQAHKLTSLEIDSINADGDDGLRLQRLYMILALKQAYITAVGHPSTFDYSRLEFDVPNQTVMADSFPLIGWEFRMWKACFEAQGMVTGEVDREEYQCASAFFRGLPTSNFIFYDSRKDLSQSACWIGLDGILEALAASNLRPLH